MTRRSLLLMPTLLAAEPPKPVFSLLLQLDQQTLRASLRNNSSTPQKYFHDSRLQPVTLQIKGPKGPLKPTDRRANAKFDPTPHRSIFQTLAPGSTILLLEATLADHVLRWGQFVFDWADEPKGSYQISAALDHKQNRWVDNETKQSGVYPDLWRGLLASAPVSLKIS
ncbi:MAG: hypothetical protein NTV52_33185 [Acidobacteria bacterium]|nr:hypothetical protein [Acidobacteriota bacterium]